MYMGVVYFICVRLKPGAACWYSDIIRARYLAADPAHNFKAKHHPPNRWYGELDEQHA